MIGNLKKNKNWPHLQWKNLEAGKNPRSYKKGPIINKSEQKPEEIKYQPTVQQTVLSKPKIIWIKALMDAKIGKSKQKRVRLKNELPKNTEESNTLKNLNKKPKLYL